MTTAVMQEKKRIAFSWPTVRTIQGIVPHLLFAVLLWLIFTPGADDATPSAAASPASSLPQNASSAPERSSAYVKESMSMQRILLETTLDA